MAIYKIDVKEKLLSGIIGMLRAHDSPILEFILGVRELGPCPEIDEILKLVSKKGRLQEIIMIMTDKRTVLDSSLFSCQQLSFLFLQSCVLKAPPEFTGFTKLVNLTLIDVDITAQLFSTLISQSPLLQGLCLGNCTFDDPVQLTAPKLNFFHFANYKTMISVDAPRLLDACLTFLSARTRIKQESTHHIKQEDVLQLKSVDTIVSLHLDHHYMKSMLRCGSRPKFEHLRVLRLSSMCFGISHEVKCILELIKSSGSLEKIIIQTLYLDPAEQEDGDDVMFGEGLDLSCSRIREVQMLDMSGSKTELAFVETMLLKLTQLETMVIALDLKNVGSDGGGEVYQFRRTSPLATIVFRDSNACKKSSICEYCQFLMRKIQVIVDADAV